MNGDVEPLNALDAAHPYARRTFIILNPKAGQDDPARLRRMIGGAFAARSAPFDLAETSCAGHAIELARSAARLGYRAVCVVGGDGTLAEAATGLDGTDVPLGLIPRGTANQVAQNLQIPTELEAAVDTVIHGTPTPLDLGRIGERAFALVAGAGYDAAVMAAATRPMKERWGFGAYVFAAVKEAIAATPADFRIVADGMEINIRAVSVMLANMGELFTHFLPFGFPLAPHPTRSWQDGLFDVVVLAPRNPAEFPAVLWRAANRRFSGDDRLIHFQAREVSIEAEPPVPVQIDGDEAGTTPIHAAVRGGIRILTPP
ncbi:MAG TPA: diacylglycerol kinase family protein [Longimicrobiales bacterium]